VLGHELIDVVVVAVVQAVDVVEPTVPACPITVTYTPFGEARHPDTIGIQAIAEVKVLYLYPMLTCCYASNDVLVFAWEGETMGNT
jgi:hypothetical protein